MQRSATSAVRETSSGHWAWSERISFKVLSRRSPLEKAGRAQLGDGRLESNGRQHILKIAPPGVVVMNIAGGDEWHSRGRGLMLPVVQTPRIVKAAMQLGDGVGSIRKDFAPASQLRRRLDGVR